MAEQAQTRGTDEDEPAREGGSGSTANRTRGSHAAPEPAVEVDVARTGGFAGITRRWSAQPPEDEASDWISLIDRCPWDRALPVADQGDPADAAPMPDRFVWWIRASWTGADPREAEVPDEDLTGAWRELVDAVREWGRAVEQPERGRR